MWGTVGKAWSKLREKFVIIFTLLMIIFDKCISFINVLYIFIILGHNFCISFFFCFVTEFIINSLLNVLQLKIKLFVNVLYSIINMYKDFYYVRAYWSRLTCKCHGTVPSTRQGSHTHTHTLPLAATQPLGYEISLLCKEVRLIGLCLNLPAWNLWRRLTFVVSSSYGHYLLLA